MPKRSDEHMAQRRDQILDAAMRSFAKKGFHKSSMKDICDEAGLSVGAVYVHFKSKRAIIQKMLTLSVEGLADIKVDSLDDCERVMLESHDNQTIGNDNLTPRLLANFISESLNDPDIRDYLQTTFDNSEKFIRSTLLRLQTEGKITADYNAETGARILLLILQGAMQHMLIYGPTAHAGSKACIQREFNLMRPRATV